MIALLLLILSNSLLGVENQKNQPHPYGSLSSVEEKISSLKQEYAVLQARKNAFAAAIIQSITKAEELNVLLFNLETKLQKKIDERKKELKSDEKPIIMNKKSLFPWIKFHAHTPFLFCFLSVFFFHKTNGAFPLHNFKYAR